MKYILVGLILVLAGVLWLLLPAREGLANPPGCPTNGEGITSIKQSGGQNIRLYTRSECSALKGNYAPNGQTSWGMATNEVGECYGVPGGQNISFCNQTAPPSSAAAAAAGIAPAAPAVPACPTKGEGITSVTQSGGQNVRLYTKGECADLKGNFTPNGQTTWGMANNEVGECTGNPGGQNLSFCNQTAPPSSAASAAVAPEPAPAPPPPPPPPPAPAPAVSSTDSLMGTLIGLLQQDITSRASLLNTANNPKVPVGSLLTQSTVDPNWQPAVNGTIPGPSASSMTMGRGALDEIPKSSLVPCTCPTYSMNCPIHVGSQPSSQVPGDTASALSKAQDQYDLMRPFTNTDRDVPGFLNSFSNFGV